MIGGYQEALAHWRAAGDLFEEATILYSIAIAYIQVGDQQKALDYATQALPVARASANTVAEAGLSIVSDKCIRPSGTRERRSRSTTGRSRWRGLPVTVGEGNTLNHLGVAMLRLGEKRKALDDFEQAIQAFLRGPGPLPSGWDVK